MAGAAHGGPTDQLKELRGRIDSLQKQLTESEESKSEAADALRETERAISDANRRLFELAGQQRDVKSTLARYKRNRGPGRHRGTAGTARKLLYHQYLSGQPDRCAHLQPAGPNEIARQLHYLATFRARADVIAALRRDLSDLDQLAAETQVKSQELARRRPTG
jgi:septal ring factor EnvC (AmiA/AmiB activator)